MDFEKAYKELLGHEGLYSNDADDNGGETYKGIARNFNKDWPGWAVIDGLKIYKDFPSYLKNNPVLENYVREFYLKNYWNKLKCDDIPFILGYELFEIAVNCGINKAVELLQGTLNVLNKNNQLYSDIKEDGMFGETTLFTLKTALSKIDINLIVKVLNLFQGMHYINIMRKNKVYEKYIGWFNRIEVTK